MSAQNDFFTLQSLATFAGATGATFVIANSIQRAFGFNPKWLALAVAEVVCLSTVAFSHYSANSTEAVVAADYFVASINGFLVFCSAAGATSAGRAVAGTAGSDGPAQQRGYVGVSNKSSSEQGGALPREAADGRATADPARSGEASGRPRRGFFSPWI